MFNIAVNFQCSIRMPTVLNWPHRKIYDIQLPGAQFNYIDSFIDSLLLQAPTKQKEIEIAMQSPRYDKM